MGRTYDEQLAWAQDIREQVADAVLNRGLDTASKEDLDILLKATKDHSQVAIASKRNQLEEEGQKSNTDILAGITAYFVQNAGNCPFIATPGTDRVGAAPMLALEDLGDQYMAKGENHIGTIAETSEQFYLRMQEEGITLTPDDEQDE